MLGRRLEGPGRDSECGTLNEKRAPARPRRQDTSQPIAPESICYDAMDGGERYLNTMIVTLKRAHMYIYSTAFVKDGRNMPIKSIFLHVKAILEKKKANIPLDTQEDVDYACFRNAVILLARVKQEGEALATVLSNLESAAHRAILSEFLEFIDIKLPAAP